MKRLIFLCGVLLWSCNMDLQDTGMEDVDFITDKDGMFQYCICSDAQATELSWDYPIKPGMEEWKQLTTYKEMLEACEIPDHILSSLSTKELAAICLHYPLLINMFAHNIPDNGIDFLFNDFNGIRELFRRDAGAKELLNWYNCQIQNFSLVENKNFLDIEKGTLIIFTKMLEFLLSRANDNYKEILQSLVKGYETKLKYYPDYLNSSLSINFFARGHIIDKMCKDCLTEEQKNNIFGSFVLEEGKDVVNKLSYRLIK